MKDARKEAWEWQEMGHALPHMSPEEKAEYDRGPSPIPAVIAILAVLVLWGVAVYVFA